MFFEGTVQTIKEIIIFENRFHTAFLEFTHIPVFYKPYATIFYQSIYE